MPLNSVIDFRRAIVEIKTIFKCMTEKQKEIHLEESIKKHKKKKV